jgi:hypothetical protein
MTVVFLLPIGGTKSNQSAQGLAKGSYADGWRISGRRARAGGEVNRFTSFQGTQLQRELPQSPYTAFTNYKIHLSFARNLTLDWPMDSMSGGEQNRSAFSYQALDPTKHEIRLILLQPGELSGDIECNILLASLHKNPEYEALSYEWGSPKSQMLPIKLDGHAYHVRENLWWALHYLRPNYYARTLWIDAICINQSDIQERNQQVAQMGKIYSLAARVVAWIGREESQGTSVPGKSAKDVVEFLKDLNTALVAGTLSSDGSLTSQGRKVLVIEDTFFKVKALSDLSGRSYWSRLWIIQELALSSKAVVQCGSITFDLNLFHSKINLHLNSILWDGSRDTTEYRATWKALLKPTKITDLRNQRAPKQEGRDKSHSTGEFSSLLSIMHDTLKSQCEDMRDKVFGVLSLSKHCCREAVPPDYTKTLTEICEDILAHQLAEHPNAKLPSNPTHTLLQALQLSFQLIDELEGPLPPMRLSLKETRREELVAKEVTLGGQILWLVYPPKVKPKSSSTISSLPLIKDLGLGDLISVLEPATNDEIWSINRPDPHLEGGHFYFRADSEYPSISLRSKSCVIVPNGSTKLLINPFPAGKTKFSNITSKFSTKNKQLQLHADNLWEKWERIVAERAEFLSARQVGIFITDTGIVGYATRGCKTGDLICADFGDLPEAGWVAIIGAEGPRHRVVGKGAILGAPDSILKRESEARRVEAHLDIATLLYLNGYF